MKTQTYSKTELVSLLQKWVQKNGHVPSKRQLNADANMPSDMAYRKAFGSWGNALIYCGYNVAKPFPSEKCRVAAGNAKRGKKGENAANWKGGRIKSKFGYILIWNSEYKRYVPEHRKIMEEYLGRKLLSNEDVHHINRIKDDNRIENLQVISHSEHTLLHEKEDKVKHICKSGKKCLFPDCETITNSKYGLCAKHYRRQWDRLKKGAISDMHDFSQSKRKLSDETKENCENVQLSKEELTANLQATFTTIWSCWKESDSNEQLLS